MQDIKDKENDMLKYALENGMIDLSYIQEQIAMNKREQILKVYGQGIWQGNNGKWYVYLPDEEKGRVLKKRSTEEDIKNLVVDFYSVNNKTQKEQNKLKDVEDHYFSTLYDIWKKKQIMYGISPNTISKYNYDYKRFFQGTEFEKMDIREITEEDISIFIISKIKELGLKEKAGKALWGYISGVFKSARVNRVITEDPCLYIDTKSFFRFYDKTQKPLESRILCENEMKLIINQIKKDHENKPDYIPSYAVELAIYTGMRTGELAGLKWDDVLMEDRIIIIRHSEKCNRLNKEHYMSSTKTQKERRFPISDEVYDFFLRMQTLQEEYGCFENFVFSIKSGKIHINTISNCMRNKCIQVGIETKSIHALRRTLNSKMRCAGVSSVVAASLLGHTEEVNQTNYTYDITQMDYKRDIIEKISKQVTKAAF